MKIDWIMVHSCLAAILNFSVILKCCVFHIHIFFFLWSRPSKYFIRSNLKLIAPETVFFYNCSSIIWWILIESPLADMRHIYFQEDLLLDLLFYFWIELVKSRGCKFDRQLGNFRKFNKFLGILKNFRNLGFFPI
jgi:hypothetical protein